MNYRLPHEIYRKIILIPLILFALLIPIISFFVSAQMKHDIILELEKQKGYLTGFIETEKKSFLEKADKLANSVDFIVPSYYEIDYQIHSFLKSSIKNENLTSVYYQSDNTRKSPILESVNKNPIFFSAHTLDYIADEDKNCSLLLINDRISMLAQVPVMYKNKNLGRLQITSELKNPDEDLYRIISLTNHESDIFIDDNENSLLIKLFTDPKLKTSFYLSYTYYRNSESNRFIFVIFAIFIIFLLLLIAILISSFYVGQGIARPIVKLAEVTEKISLGENPEILSPPNTSLEIRTLYKNVSNMINNLHTFQRNLESKIEEAVDTIRHQDTILVTQSRHAAMGEMIGNIAHQWRQPLNAVNLLIHDLLDAQNNNELDRKYLENTIDQMQNLIFHMSRTIDDFRDFVKPDKNIEKKWLKEVIKQVLSLMEGSLKQNSVLLEEQIETDLLIEMVPNELAQALLNILENAIHIFKERDIKERKIILKLTKAESGYIFKVSDNAGGVDNDIKDKIFDPYFSSRTEDNMGSGLGLYMSQKLIKDNFGQILSVHNEDDHAVFSFVIPGRIIYGKN